MNFFTRSKIKCKNLLLKFEAGRYLSFLIRPAALVSNTLKLSQWIRKYGGKYITKCRDREVLYEFVYASEVAGLDICYLEFGVFEGKSMQWWLARDNNFCSRFYGFDTFEGLPEPWGHYNKGHFNANIPTMADYRVCFIKGLFQETLQDFCTYKKILLGQRLVIHMDADLFSSTLFVLTSIARFLKEGDILIFDEFNVPNDEFSAWEIFCRSYYVGYKVIANTPNYSQVAIKLTEWNIAT